VAAARALGEWHTAAAPAGAVVHEASA